MRQGDDDLAVRGEGTSQSPNGAAELDEPSQVVGDVLAGTSDMTFESSSSSSLSIASKARK